MNVRQGCLLTIALALPTVAIVGCRAPLASETAAPAQRPYGEIAPAAHEQLAADPEPLPLAPATDKTEKPVAKAPESIASGQPSDRPPLALTEVTESVYYAFPGLEAALREMEIAAGKEQAALGEFDLKLKGGSQNDVRGFYQTYKQAIKVEQAMWNGGSAYGQYRLGRGKYPTWDGLETNDGGEFKVGFLRPLLQNSAIDQRRADIFQATLRRQQVEPAVQALILELVRDAQGALGVGRGGSRVAVQRGYCG
jgi:hypothetical protein